MWVPPIAHVEDLLLPGNARRYSRHELKKIPYLYTARVIGLGNLVPDTI